MVRGVIIQPDNYGRIRVSDVLCIGQNGVIVEQLFNHGLDLGFGKRQFVVCGLLPADVDGALLFPGDVVPENHQLVPVLFMLKRYEVIFCQYQMISRKLNKQSILL